MYELIQVAERSYYIQSPAKIGLVKLNEQDICLIDSGNDKDAGRPIAPTRSSPDFGCNSFAPKPGSTHT